MKKFLYCVIIYLPEWEEIDNTLNTVETAEGENNYENKNSFLEYSFPEDLDSDEAVTISSGEHTISIKHLEISKNSKSQKKQKKSASKIKKTTDKYMEALPLTDEIVYNNTDENTNLEYEVGSLGIKENIVLTKKPNKHLQYKYFIASDTLQAVLNKDSSISFYVGDGTNEDDIIFYIPAPYMFDSNNVESYNILTTLDKTKDGYILTYKPDSEWLRDKSRVYPVTIDPTVNATDTVISAYTCTGGGYNDYVLSWEQQLKVGYDRFMSPTGYHETYVRFPFLPTIPSGCTVTSAYISLCRRGGSSTSITIGTYKVLHDWNPGTLTYDTRPSCDENMISSRLCSGNSGEYYDWYITDTVLEWYQKRNTYGIRFSSLYSDDFISFHSTRSTYTNMVPKLTINYTHSDDLDSDNLSGATNMNSVGNRTTITRNLDHSNDTDCFKFTPTSSGNYDIFTTSNIDTVGVLYSGTAANSKIADNDDPSGFTFADFAITANLTAGHTYYVEVFSSNSDTGTFTLTVAKRDDHSNASGLATSVNLGISKSGTINYNGDEDWFVFNCTNGGLYNVYSSGSTDTVGALYELENGSLTSVGQDNNGDLNDNFRINTNLKSNTKYYLQVKHSSTGTGNYYIHFEPALKTNVKYCLKNVRSGKYLSVSQNMGAIQDDFTGEGKQVWSLEYVSDGAYRITNEQYENYYLRSLDNNKVVVSQNEADNYWQQLWCLRYELSGGYSLNANSANYTKRAAVVDGSYAPGAEIILTVGIPSIITDNGEWIFEEIKQDHYECFFDNVTVVGFNQFGGADIYGEYTITYLDYQNQRKLISIVSEAYTNQYKVSSIAERIVFEVKFVYNSINGEISRDGQYLLKDNGFEDLTYYSFYNNYNKNVSIPTNIICRSEFRINGSDTMPRCFDGIITLD